MIIYPCTHISIPYGAIKSGVWKTALQLRFAISIPYGAIKSQGVQVTFDALEVFQFLMVRLKGIAFTELLIIGIYFNSLWCD